MIQKSIQRNVAALSYIFMDGRAFLPKSIMLEVTYKCNLRCKMCGYYGDSGSKRDSKKELSIEDIERIFDDISSFSPFVTITGGEPFIRKDMVDILELLKERNLKFGILTNGTLINDDIAKRVANLGPQFINISIDGPEDVHETIRGPKTFSRAIEGIKLLKNYGYSRITMNCVISKINFERLEELVDIASGLGTNLQYQHLQFTDRQKDDEHRKKIKQYFDFDNEDRTSGICTQLYNFDTNKLLEQITKIRASNVKNRINFLPDLSLKEIERYYNDLDNYVHSEYCLYPWREARINPYGELSYCIMEPIAGCLVGSPFKSIWNNENMVQFRRILKKEKLFPNCARCCKI